MSEYFEVVTNAQTGEVTQRPLTQAEIAALQPTTEQLASEARAQRNALLSASDWTQVADAPVDKVIWGAYRQALRDITAQAGFPVTINWPVAP
jgi:hypothetical protein